MKLVLPTDEEMEEIKEMHTKQLDNEERRIIREKIGWPPEQYYNFEGGDLAFMRYILKTMDHEPKRKTNFDDEIIDSFKKYRKGIECEVYSKKIICKLCNHVHHYDDKPQFKFHIYKHVDYKAWEERIKKEDPDIYMNLFHKMYDELN